MYKRQPDACVHNAFGDTVYYNQCPSNPDVRTYMTALVDDVCSLSLIHILAQKLGAEQVLVLPCVPYGQVWSLRAAPGTVDIPDAVLVPYLTHIALSMYRAGDVYKRQAGRLSRN